MVAACSSKDEFSQDTSQKPIVVKASINDLNANTRSTGDATALQHTAFLDGEKINVFFKEEKNGVTSNIPGVPSNPGYIIYKKTGDAWTAQNAESTLMWPAYSDLLTTAIYPSTDKDDTPITLSTNKFEVNSQQILDKDYRKSDLMFASESALDREYGTVNFSFNHKLTKITIVIDPSNLFDDVSDFNSKVDEIMIYAKTQALLDNSFKATGVAGNYNWITLWQKSIGTTYNPSGVSCIIPSQNIPGNQEFLSFMYQGGGDVYYTYKTPAEGFSFVAGKEYVFTISLANKSLVFESPSIYNWTQVPKTGVAD